MNFSVQAPVVSSCTIIFLVEVGNRDAAMPRQHLADPPAKYKESKRPSSDTTLPN